MYSDGFLPAILALQTSREGAPPFPSAEKMQLGLTQALLCIRGYVTCGDTSAPTWPETPKTKVFPGSHKKIFFLDASLVLLTMKNETFEKAINF